jgi:hypothetical protein
MKENEDCRKQYNQELMQMSGELDISSFVRTAWLNWTGHFNRMGSKKKVKYFIIIIHREEDKEDDKKQIVKLCTN